jgi:hypothetical protein
MGESVYKMFEIFVTGSGLSSMDRANAFPKGFLASQIAIYFALEFLAGQLAGFAYKLEKSSR